MTERTWSERGAWMDAHEAAITHWGDNSASVLYRTNRTGAPLSCGPQMPRATDAIDAAMDECERLEKAAAEKKANDAFCQHQIQPLMAEAWRACIDEQVRENARLRKELEALRPEKAPSPASPSPVAALLGDWSAERDAKFNMGESDHAISLRLNGVIAQLRAAIAQQAAQWREEADDLDNTLVVESPAVPRWRMNTTRANCLRRCADELEAR